MKGIGLESVEHFFEQWAGAICDTLRPITGKPWTSRVNKADELGAGDTESIFLTFSVSEPLSGMFRSALSRSAALQLNFLFTGSESSEWNTEQQETIDELSRQFAGQFAAALKPELGEVHLELQKDAPFTGSGDGYRLALSQADGIELFAVLELDDALRKKLQPDPAAVSADNHSVQSTNLDLLLDVELDVTLRFGQREMLLQDILELQSGSVVELDREIQDPVELLLDGRVIARGSVVVVDGNYGLRVAEVGAFAEA
ncbi:flagellar motor switch protein FliN [Candidatus Korobacter versatilis]|uniref:flagellar motor switch protein FliN n=1 Tax=Candidatus Korobacter versatilis TaxID=658062 RepID=UPI00030406AB|nr:flagellar motor switch protein FliN [Candidatus Koribacter versatilis]